MSSHRRLLLLPVLVCLLMLGACGSDGARGAGPAPVPGDGAGVAATGAADASGIPGLSAAELAAMPEAPPLPARLGKDSQPEDIEREALAEAQREQRRKALEGITVDQRAIHLAHVWGQAVHVLRRGEPSQVPGLTIGELEDQPLAPELPGIFDLGATPEDLAHHARIVALEERAQGILGELAIEARVAYLAWFWQRPLAERAAITRAWLDRRAARSAHEVETAARLARFDADNQTMRSHYDERIIEARMQHNPVLDPAQERYLDELAEHYRFEEDYGNDKPFRGPVQ